VDACNFVFVVDVVFVREDDDRAMLVVVVFDVCAVHVVDCFSYFCKDCGAVVSCDDFGVSVAVESSEVAFDQPGGGIAEIVYREGDRGGALGRFWFCADDEVVVSFSDVEGVSCADGALFGVLGGEADRECSLSDFVDFAFHGGTMTQRYLTFF